MLDAVFFLFLTLASSHSEPLRDPSSEFERQARAADFIIIARPRSYEVVEIENVGKARAAVVEVEFSLDSQISNKHIRVVVSAPYSHAEVDCCILDQRYIFLVNEHQNLFYPVRDGNGAHLLHSKSEQ